MRLVQCSHYWRGPVFFFLSRLLKKAHTSSIGLSHAGMLEQITLSHEGQRLPLKAVASTTVRDSQTLQVSVFNAEVSRKILRRALRLFSSCNCCTAWSLVLMPHARQLLETATLCGADLDH